MPIIKQKIIPFGKNFFAINLCGIIFAKGDCNEITLNHERIHSRQILELFVLPFYIWYVVEWTIRYIRCRNWMMAYHNISFEREAYRNQNNLTYLKHRKNYSFIRYLKK